MRRRGKFYPSLSGQVAEEVRKGLPWATPCARDYKSGAVSAETLDRNSRPISEQVVDPQSGSAWPTPTASRYGTRNNGCPGDGRDEYATKGSPSLETMCNPLNPDWVEALMGFPIGWTVGPLDEDSVSTVGSLRERDPSSTPETSD